MLDVVEVDHHVVAHLKRQVQLLELLAGSGVGRLLRVHGRHLVADGGAVNLHEDEAEPVGDVLHERGFAVAGGREQQEQAHEVGAPVFAGGAHLLGQVGADEGQVHLVDEPVAHKRRQHPRLELA